MFAIPCVMFHVSRAMCHVSHVTKKYFFLLEKVVELVGRGSVINGLNPSSFVWNHTVVKCVLEIFINVDLYVQVAEER